MAKSQKAKKLDEARALYAEGATKRVIAGSLKVSPSTVRRWAREEAEAGRPWRRPVSSFEFQVSSSERPSTRDPKPETRNPLEPGPAGRASAPAGAEEPLSDRLCRKLEEQLERLIEAGQGGAKGPRLEDRMLKICKVLDYLRGEKDDLGSQLEAMKRFATFCVRTLTESEIGPVRKAIRLFMEELRKEHS